MIIKFTPQLSGRAPANISVAGEAITIDSVVLDLSQLPDGASLPREAIACEWIADDVRRIDGVLHVPVVLAISADASEAACFPEPITVTKDGPVEMPV